MLIDGEEMSSSKGYGESMNRYQRHRNFSGLIFWYQKCICPNIICQICKMNLYRLKMSSSEGWNEWLPKAREPLQPHCLISKIYLSKHYSSMRWGVTKGTGTSLASSFDIKNVYVQILFVKFAKWIWTNCKMCSSEGWNEWLPKALELLQPHLLRFSLASCMAQWPSPSEVNTLHCLVKGYYCYS